MARRPGQLTEEDKLKLQRQGMLSKPQQELGIIKFRYKFDKNCTIVEVKSGHSVSCKEVTENIGDLLNTTENDGGKGISDDQG